MLQLLRTHTCYIEKFVIYGERHSGTNFLEKCIKDQFAIDKTEFYDNKHFFGWSKPEVITYKGRHTLFIGIVRNPYDWISAMISLPHHVEYTRILNIDKFLLDEWYSIDYHDKEILEDRNYTNRKRYKNIFEMRKYKYLFLSQIMPLIARNYVLLSYDSFLKNHNNYLNIIGNRFDLKTKGIPPEVDKDKKPYNINNHILDIINNNIDWDIEASLGFFRKPQEA
jgi:hypothetical protein